MDANAFPVLSVFEKKMRLEVPLFQRQYVWTREQQWEPLWEDIARKFSEYLEGRTDSPVHFLGAMVLDQKQTPTLHVEKRQIIDGQQRLTTLQIFLAAFRDFCAANGCAPLADELSNFTANRGMLNEPDVDKFKVWPTQLDRQQFADVVTLGSPGAVTAKYPIVRRKYARKPDPRPLMVEAYLFFFEQLSDFFQGDGFDPPTLQEMPLMTRVEKCFQARRNALRVVVIDLQQDDDAQIIFETLNARGEPLLPADLLRNYIFLRAARYNEQQETLYERYWRSFDEPFWREEVRQGRLNRPRSDLYLQHFLTSRQTQDIPVKHLFVEYKHWIERTRPFKSVEQELVALAKQGTDFRRMVDPQRDDPLFDLFAFLRVFDISTAYPLLLLLLDANLPGDTWSGISKIIESYFLRRAICGLTPKNYNRVCLALAKQLRDPALRTAEHIRKYFSDLEGETVEWPSDSRFSASWLEREAYGPSSSGRLVYIFQRLNERLFRRGMERIAINSDLTIEHLLPQAWVEHWPLPDGSRGLDPEGYEDDGPNRLRTEMSIARNSLVQTFGNLTILTQPLNSAVSNGPWREKRHEIVRTSLLPLSQQLQEFETWNESAIRSRGRSLLDHALDLWPGPAR